MIPRPPSWARAIASEDSVTVSIGAEIKGMLMVIRRVRRVDGSADSGVISLYAGTSSTSSKVIAS